MPFFGLVWVASWVGCFFSSSQELLTIPSHQPCVSPLANPVSIDNFQPLSAPGTQPQARFAVLDAVAKSSTAESGFQVVDRSIAEPVTPPDQATSRFPSWLKAASTRLLRPWVQSSRQQTPVPEGSLSPVLPIASTELGLPSPPVSPFEVLQNLVLGLQATITGVPNPAATVVVTQIRPNTSLTQAGSSASSLSLGFGERAASSGDQPVFQVRVKGQVIAETLSQQRAGRIARQLEQLLADPNLDVAQVHPAFVDGKPAAKFGDRVLFTVEPDIASASGCNSELLAIEWTNNLRVALEAAPLPLVTAQEEMHRLQETGERLEGLASWYGPYFHGRQTATGELFDQNEFTAAHPSLPFDTYLRVTNLNNGKSIIVRVNDRGPYFENRLLDLSREAARSLGSEETGVVPIEAEIMQSTSPRPSDHQDIARL